MPPDTKPPTPWDFFILVISVYVLVAMAVMKFLSGNSEMLILFEKLDFVVCLIFLVDFLRRLKNAPDRKKYFFTWGWIDLLSSIPAVNFLRWGRMIRIFRILRLMRAFRSARELYYFLIKQRQKSAILAALCLLLFSAFMGAILILEFETGTTSGIDTAEEALWWAIVTMTTVGYGDLVPVSTEGRILASVMMIAGLCFLAILTGAFAGWFTDNAKEDQELALMRKDLALIKEKLGIKEDSDGFSLSEKD